MPTTLRSTVRKHEGGWLPPGWVRLPVGVLALALALLFAGAAEAANPTTLSINCTPKALWPGATASCVATVTDSGPVASRIPPAGTVSFTVTGSGTFDLGDTCALEPSGAFSSKCTVAYTATAISGGTHKLLGAYNGEDGHGRATSTFTLTVTPVNDDLETATLLPVPGKLTGTTEGATYSSDDPDLCSDAYAPVWYLLKPPRSGRMAVQLTAHGRTDSVVAVFRQERSKLTPLGCDLTNASGVAGVPFDAARGTTYLVAVAAPWSAEVGEFIVTSVLVPPVTFPGIRLAHDADVLLDPLLRPSAAFSVRMREATTYRINATARGACVQVDLLRQPVPAADDLVRSEGCSGYLVYTPRPGRSGFFPLLVSMPEGSVARVHVALRRVDADDLAPGLPLLNGTVRHGRLSARDADVVDSYRFDVSSRADATLTLHGGVSADLLLFDTKGKQLACACEGRRNASLTERLAPGSYLTLVRARPAETGPYALTLRLRQPTATAVRLKAGAQSTLQLSANVHPAVPGGRFVLELDRFDPLSNWQFVATSSHAASGGRTTFSLKPTIGGWRVRVQYHGTLSASPSVSGWINLNIHKGVHGGQTAATGGSCVPKSSTTFSVGAMTVTCGGTPFGQKPATQAKTPSQALTDLRKLVSGIPTLKDPFRSDLLDTLDAAQEALSDEKPDNAWARLEDFISKLQAAPLQTQLTKNQRDQLIYAAKQIETQIGR
jgi:hypothetical protein